MSYDLPPPSSHFEQVVEKPKPCSKESVVATPEKFVVPGLVRQEAFYLMAQVEGWCSQEKAGVLVDIVLKAKPDTIVEIGVWGGKSLIPMATALRANGKGRIFGIDPWSNAASTEWVMNEVNKSFWNYVDHELVFQELQRKLYQFDLFDYVELIRSKSEDAPPIQCIDILHVDGNHSEETSYLDVKKWAPLVRSGGWIIFDDMSWFENGKATTARAVEWLDTHCLKIAEFSDTCLWGIWVKP